MTKAEELRRAALRLREQARAAIEQHIQGDDGQVMRFVAIEPATAGLVAEVFDQWAWIAEKDPDLIHRIGGPETLAAARSINEVPR